MMLYLELFFSFMKIGFTSFGGMSMIPLILDEMQSHGWMSTEDLTNLVAIAEMTPGPLGINCATFAGTQTGGVAGSLAAVAGVLTPAVTLTLLVAVFFQKFRKSRIMVEMMSFVKPICIGMILAVILTLSEETYLEGMDVNWAGLLISAEVWYLLAKRNWSVPKVIVNAAVLGVLIYG